jgi:hypothetical protein
MSFDAFCGWSQIFGSSASRFSSARRRSDFSKSKRPPQQPDRLLDLLDSALRFGAHFRFPVPGKSIVTDRLRSKSAADDYDLNVAIYWHEIIIG